MIADIYKNADQHVAGGKDYAEDYPGNQEGLLVGEGAFYEGAGYLEGDFLQELVDVVPSGVVGGVAVFDCQDYPADQDEQEYD